MLHKIVTIGKNSIKRRNFLVMTHKLLLRIKEDKLQNNGKQMLSWCQKQAVPYEDFLKSLDKDLWAETEIICSKLKEKSEKKLKNLGLDMGGGGNFPLLYFLTRYINAKTVVETGVAAGWSSQALLAALEKNGHNGKLFSSDFPYFRYESPEKLVGYVVDKSLKDNWTLYIDGDRNNLPKITEQINTIDLFHYDSDKSYSGRKYAIKLLTPKMDKNTVIIFDDIQDNTHFKDHIEQYQRKFKIFEFNGKYIGLIAPFL